MDMVKNITVMTKPSEKAPHEVLNAVPGAKVPITKEPKAIFAPPKKKSQVMLDLSFISIKNKFTTIDADCQCGKSHKIMADRKHGLAEEAKYRNYAHKKLCK